MLEGTGLISYLSAAMHQIVGLLLQPVIALLLLLVAGAILDSGIALGERLSRFRRWQSLPLPELELRARRRIERTDFYARLGPLLGLMGTLIPLGPGLAALGNGDVKILSTAIQVAFDTTVLGLLIGATGFVLGRLRRRWYDALLSAREEAEASLTAIFHATNNSSESRSENNKEARDDTALAS